MISTATAPVFRSKQHNVIPAPLGATYNIGGVDIPIKEYMTFPDLGLSTPLPVIETESDYRWQYGALMSRLEHPDWYTDENVYQTIEELKQWLKENRHKASANDPIYTEE